MKIGILTCEKLADLHYDDKKLISAFKQHDIEASPVVWDQENEWQNYDCVIIRTPWDYARRWDEFQPVLIEIANKTKLIHSREMIQWNADKTYLQKIGNDQIKKIPTLHFKNFSTESFEQSFQELNVEEIVFKPHVGASGVDTFRVTKDQVQEVDNLFGREVLAQPFLKSIVEKGEYSLIYFGHKFSHAVLKSPKNGEFRVQEEHGGEVERFHPTVEQIKAGEDFLNGLDFSFAYARVDIAIEPNDIFLMELEVIEPELFFRFSDNGEEKYAAAIMNQLG